MATKYFFLFTALLATLIMKLGYQVKSFLLTLTIFIFAFRHLCHKCKQQKKKQDLPYVLVPSA